MISGKDAIFIIIVVLLFIGAFLYLNAWQNTILTDQVDYKYSRIDSSGNSARQVFILNINNTEYSVKQSDYVKIKVGDTVKIKQPYGNNSNMINSVRVV